ncbi:MAG: adenylate/guanylate cyclase domain-containing protein [Spirochaetota bacterium]
MFPTEKLIGQAENLKFEKSFEDKFRQETAGESSQRLFFLAISVLIFAVAYGIIDSIAFSDSFARIRFARLLSLLLAVITAVLCMRNEIAAGVSREHLSLANLLVFGIVQTFIMFLGKSSEIGYEMYFASLSVVIIAAATFFAPLFYMMISGLNLFLYNILFLIASNRKIVPGGNDLNFLLISDVFLFSVALIGLRASYYIESSDRKEFVYNKKSENYEDKEDYTFHRILPDSIATKIKENLGATGNGYENTTVLFSEITGFPKLSQTIPQSVLADYLNEFEKEFDVLAKKYDVEKIVTDGEEFWLLSGLPEYIPNHAEIMANMAIEMRDAVARVCRRTNKQFQVRIGINSGPVVACWFGKEGLYIYDLHGDTLKTGSAMESHGITGEIQVSESTYKQLQGRYEMYERGDINIAGNLMVKAYLLKRKL